MQESIHLPCSKQLQRARSQNLLRAAILAALAAFLSEPNLLRSQSTQEQQSRTALATSQATSSSSDAQAGVKAEADHSPAAEGSANQIDERELVGLPLNG